MTHYVHRVRKFQPEYLISLLSQKPHILLKSIEFINSRTYTQIHLLIVVQEVGGGWTPAPRVFDMLQYFEVCRILVALLEASDVTNNGRYLGCYQELG